VALAVGHETRTLKRFSSPPKATMARRMAFSRLVPGTGMLVTFTPSRKRLAAEASSVKGQLVMLSPAKVTRAEAVAAQEPEEILHLALGRGQAVGLEILREHALAGVQGHDDVQPATLDLGHLGSDLGRAGRRGSPPGQDEKKILRRRRLGLKPWTRRPKSLSLTRRLLAF